MSIIYHTIALQKRLNDAGIPASFDDANELRRAQLTLHRWCELECGDGDEWKSWSIERDERTNVPYMCVYPHNGQSQRYRVPDRETGALRRAHKLCVRLGISYFYQTDPRGCALYVARGILNRSNYTRGIACLG